MLAECRLGSHFITSGRCAVAIREFCKPVLIGPGTVVSVPVLVPFTVPVQAAWTRTAREFILVPVAKNISSSAW